MNSKKQVAVLSDIQQLMTRNYASTRQFLKDVLSRSIELLDADAGFIGLVTTDGHRRVVRVWDQLRLLGATAGHWDRQVRDLPVGTRALPARDRSLTGRVAHLKKPRRIHDVRRARFFRADNRATRSSLAVPVLVDGFVIAVINLESRTLGAFDLEKQDILTLVARMIAPRLDQRLLREGLRGSIRTLLDALRAELSSILSGPLDSKSLDPVARLVAKQFDYSRCRLWLINQAGSQLLLRGSSGGWCPLRRTLGTTSKTQAVWRSVLCSEVGAEVASKTRVLQSSSVVAVPIIANGAAIGAIEVWRRHRRGGQSPSPLSALEMEALQIVQGQVSAALEIRGLQKLRQDEAVHQTRRLSELAQIFSHPDLERTLQSVVVRIPKLVGCRGCSIFLWDSVRNLFTLRASNTLSSELYGKEGYARKEGLTGWVADQGRCLNLQNRTKRELARASKDRHLRWKGKFEDGGRGDLRPAPFLAVPVFVGGRSFGVIRISDRVQPGPFSESDLEMLTAVATNVSSTMAFQRHAEEQLRLVGTLRNVTSSLTERLAVLRGASDTSLKAVIHGALESARLAMNADVLTLYPYDPDHDRLETPPIYVGDIRQPNLMAHQLYSDDAPWQVFRHPTRARFWRSMSGLRSLLGSTPARDGYPSKLRFSVREGIVSAVGLRLEVAATPVGILFVNFRSRQKFQPAQRELIQTFAGSLALTLEVARLYRVIRRMASSEAAMFLAQDLHDMVLTFLTGSALERCDAVRESLQRRDFERASGDLASAVGAVHHVVSELRNMMGLLIESSGSERGLIEELRLVRTAVWEAQGCRVDLPDRDVALPGHVKFHLYMMVLSAVSNSIAKGHATHITVAIKRATGQIVMRVADNGCGFDVQNALSKDFHYGLRGIRRRAGLLGGNVDFESGQGEGARIRVTVPVNKGQHDATAA
jgi:signal transduction histidine kinase